MTITERGENADEFATVGHGKPGYPTSERGDAGVHSSAAKEIHCRNVRLRLRGSAEARCQSYAWRVASEPLCHTEVVLYLESVRNDMTDEVDLTLRTADKVP